MKEREIWHKRLYHMYSDVIFGWILWFWLSSWHFYLSILILFRDRLENLPGDPRRPFFRECAGPPLPLLRPSSALRASSGLRSGNGGPACLPANFQAIAKKNQNIRNKVPTTQPNPQYSAKNNVTMHMIDTFMPPPSHRFIYNNVCTNTYLWEKMTFIVFLSV